MIKVHDVFIRNKLRERQHSSEVENSWEISYGDMITLLLAFFVMFFNIKSETVNMKLIKKDLDKYFSTKKEGREPTSKPGTAEDHGPQKANLPIISSQVQNSLKVQSNIYGQNILVDFPDIEFFRSGKVALTSQGRGALTEFTKAISNHLGSFRLVVRGYTDNTPLRHSKFKDNLELSAARSIAAIRFMNTQGIDTQYMRIAGYGESDGSRENKVQTSTQRKISIVLEPLEHIEKADSKSPKSDSRDKTSIEEAKAVKVSVQDKKTTFASGVTQEYLKSAQRWMASLKIKEEFYKARQPATYLNWIESRVWYQDLLYWSIEGDLRDQGFSEEEVNKEVKKIKMILKQGRNL